MPTIDPSPLFPSSGKGERLDGEGSYAFGILNVSQRQIPADPARVRRARVVEEDEVIGHRAARHRGCGGYCRSFRLRRF
nr:hypothetical protein CFP56_36418 [Quercus suber]